MKLNKSTNDLFKKAKELNSMIEDNYAVSVERDSKSENLI